MDVVDFVNTISDNMWDIYDTLGVQATRTFLVEEFKKVMSSDGSYINPSHLFILADSIVGNGEIKSVRRNGINRSVGPITKACFEECFTNLVHSAIFTEVDNMNSVSSNIACGRLCNIGTNSGYNEIVA